MIVHVHDLTQTNHKLFLYITLHHMYMYMYMQHICIVHVRTSNSSVPHIHVHVVFPPSPPPPHRNCLTWRDVQNILVYTAVKVDPQQAQWARNGAGFHHSNQHGFGLLDAYRMTTAAAVRELVTGGVEIPPPSLSFPSLPSYSVTCTLYMYTYMYIHVVTCTCTSSLFPSSSFHPSSLFVPSTVPLSPPKTQPNTTQHPKTKTKKAMFM